MGHIRQTGCTAFAAIKAQFKGSAIFTAAETFFSLASALALAVALAVSTVVGLMGGMLFDQHIGPISGFVRALGWDFILGVSYNDTGAAMITVATSKQIPVNFIFFLSGLQSIPNPLEASRLDCRSPARWVWTVGLDGVVFVAGTDQFFSADHQHHLRAAGNLRSDQRDFEGRVGQLLFLYIYIFIYYAVIRSDAVAAAAEHLTGV
ncbi:MAG: hypothetical protein ACJAVR_001014 [Paracoccaceae bacterium]